MQGTLAMTISLSPEEVRTLLSGEIDQSRLSRFFPLHLGKGRFVGRVDGSSFRFMPTMHLLWMRSSLTCEGTFGPCEKGTHISARIRRSWYPKFSLLYAALFLGAIALFIVGSAIHGRADLGWIGFFLFVVIIALGNLWMILAAEEHYEWRISQFLTGLFGGVVVASHWDDA